MILMDKIDMFALSKLVLSNHHDDDVVGVVGEAKNALHLIDCLILDVVIYVVVK